MSNQHKREPRTEEEAWQRFKAALVEQHVIEPCRALYAQASNPIHALAAYRAARAAKLDIPDWILELFDKWAEAVWVERPKGAKAIADALGLATKGGPPPSGSPGAPRRLCSAPAKELGLADQPLPSVEKESTGRSRGRPV